MGLLLYLQTPMAMENKELYDLPNEDKGNDEIEEITESSTDIQPDEELQTDEKSDKSSEKSKDEDKQLGDINFDLLTREEIIETFQQIVADKPLSKHSRTVTSMRISFDKKTKSEEERAKSKFIEDGNSEEDFELPEDKLKSQFYKTFSEFQTNRQKESEDIEAQKEENLKAKYEVIEGIKELLNKQESVNETFQEFKALQQKWHDIGKVPQGKLQDMWDTYHHHIENFYNYVKINNELLDLDLKKNIEIKTDLCEKAEALLLDPSPIKAAKALQKLHDRWRETGPVHRDKKEQLWERFKEATAKVNQRQNEHYESIRNQMVQNLKAKEELCEKAEAILVEEITSPRVWEEKSKELIDLQKVWKTIGFAPKKENNAIYARFRTACDTFFSNKREFFKDFKDEQNNNLQLKTELCIRAEALKDSEDWRKTTQEFIEIQKEWKKIGPVARKHSDAIWKRFRTACDFFFDKKSEFFKDIDAKQDENLKLKEAIIEEVKAYDIDSKEEDESIKDLQEIQRRWAEIGFVPIKEKDRINQEFRNLINQKFNKLNLDEEEKNIQIYINKLEGWKLTNQFNEKIGSERHKLSTRLKQLENDIVVWENNIGFFSKSKKSDALMHNFKKRIKNAKDSMELISRKLEIIEEML